MHVAVVDHVRHRRSLLVAHAQLVELRLELRQERHVRRADDVGLRVELRHRVEDRVHRAHPHVAHEQEGEAVDRPQLALRRVEVGQHLRRVLAPAVAAVDHGDRRPAGRLGRRTLLEVPHRDDVAVVLQHVHRVLDRLLVEVAGARVLRVGEAEDVPTEPVHRGLGGEPRAGARLVEGCQQGLAAEQVCVLAVACDRGELVSDLEDTLELGALKALERQDVAPEKAPHLVSFLWTGVDGWPR